MRIYLLAIFFFLSSFAWSQTETLNCIEGLYYQQDYLGIIDQYPKVEYHGVVFEVNSIKTFLAFPLQIDTDSSQVSIIDQDNNSVLLTIANAPAFATAEAAISMIRECNKSQDNQQITIVLDSLFLENGGEVDLSPYLDNTDHQQIDTFYYRHDIQAIVLQIENGGGASASLSQLKNELSYSGDDLNIQGSSNPPIDLSVYRDPDDQQIDSITRVGDIVTIYIEDGGSKSVNIAPDPESDPVYSGDPASDITQTDIDNWNVDDVDDADSDPFNEKDSITASQSANYNFVIDGAITNGETVFEIILDSTMSSVFAIGGGSDNQQISYDDETYIITLQNGGNIDISGLSNSNVSYADYFGFTSIAINSIVSLPQENDKWQVELNGLNCYVETVLTNHQQVSRSGNTITFFENLESDDVVRITVH